MHLTRPSLFAVSIVLSLICLAAEPTTAPWLEKLRNDKVLVRQFTLAPGRIFFVTAPPQAGVAVWLDDGTVGEASTSKTVKRGDTEFMQPLSIKNAGASPLRFVLIQFLTDGNDAVTWGSAGLAPHYKLLLENRYARVYDIKIAAGESEPMHSHKERVVVGLSGADLEHILPDGRKETSSLKTDEVVWRAAATHIGHNLGKTDLWAIAIEPK